MADLLNLGAVRLKGFAGGGRFLKKEIDMNNSNLPLGCASADGGINHGYEAAEEKALEMAIAAGLDAEELIYAMSVGIKAVELMRPMITQAVNFELSMVGY